MDYLSVANLSKYQHYSKRNPPWVKLHREFLTDYTLRTFPVPTRFLFSCLWLLASETENKIPYNLGWLSERIGMKVTESILAPLLASKLLAATLSVSVSVSVSPLSLTDDSKALAGRMQHASEVLANKSPVALDLFEQFWSAYPKKIGKGAARKAWKRLNPVNGLYDRICQQVAKASQTEQWTKEGGKFVPHPATWLNQSRWEDTYGPEDATQSTHSGFAQKDYRAGTW